MFWLLLVFFIRLGVGGILILAGWSKLRIEESAFLKVVLAYELLPQGLAKALTRSLPPLEILVGSLLILGLLTSLAYIAGIILLLIVTSAVIIALLRAKDISCGCFGIKEQAKPIRWNLVIRNVILILGLGFAYASEGSVLTFDSWLSNIGTGLHWLIGLLTILGIEGAIYWYSRSRHKSHRQTMANLPQQAAS